MDTGIIILPLLRAAHVAALLSLFGTLLFAIVVAPAPLRATPPAAAETVRVALARLARSSLVLALTLGIAWFVAEARASATPDSLAGSIAALPAVARDTRFGQVFALRMALLLVALLLPRRAPVAAIVLAGLALSLQPELGHAGAQGVGTGPLLAGAEALHVLAAGAWLGGQLPLRICIGRLPPPQAAMACKRFAPVGLVSAAAIAFTALFQSRQFIGDVPALLGTGYGRVALLKLALFVAVLALAAMYRPRLNGHAAGGGTLVRDRQRLSLLIGAETALGLAIVLAAAVLAAMTPAIREQPLWPFPWRLASAALDDPDIRVRVALALVAAGVGVASTVLGLLWRRARIALVVFGACLLLAAAPTVRLVLVEAYPTSYYRSPTRFAAVSIMHGGEVFAANCAPCHGASGRGDGILAAQLKLPPADLTAAHLWGHSDGDLFWWVSNGRPAPDGAPAMPAFASVLSDTDRWSVIDFVRANNAGASERRSGAWAVPVVAPAIPIVCAGLAADDMRDLLGGVVRVVADGDEESASHPPAIPPQAGYTVVMLHLARGSSRGMPMGECMAATPSAWGAYAKLAGLPADGLAGAEFLVDPNGWLRAAWLPNSGRGWSTPEQLITQVRLICTHPIAIDTGVGHEHHD